MSNKMSVSSEIQKATAKLNTAIDLEHNESIALIKEVSDIMNSIIESDDYVNNNSIINRENVFVK